MEHTARLFHCVRCHCQVIICGHCDRGNIYCNKSCADLARQASVRAAGKRYQSTRRGRFKHAERQRRYRLRRKKVTHQGTAPLSSNDPLVTRPEASVAVVPLEDDAIRCHFCGCVCSPFLRLDYRHRTRIAKSSGRNIIHRPRQASAQAP